MDPDPFISGMTPRIRIRTKMSQIPNTARYTSYCNTVDVYLTPAGSVAALTKVGNGGIALQNIFIIYKLVTIAVQINLPTA